MGILDSLTQDLSNFFDNSKAIYDQSTGTAPSVPQVSGLLASGDQQNVGGWGEAPGIADDASKLYKAATDPNVHGAMDAANSLLKAGGDVITSRALGTGLEAGLAIPGLGEVLGGTMAAYDGIKYGAGLLQSNGFKGLLR